MELTTYKISFKLDIKVRKAHIPEILRSDQRKKPHRRNDEALWLCDSNNELC